MWSYLQTVIRVLLGLALAAAPPPSAPLAATGAAPASDWEHDGQVRGVEMAYRPTPEGYRAYRGTTTVCTELETLQRFVGDASRLEDWIPFTEEARSLPAAGERRRYYLRTGAPWPFRSRDMVYELVPRATGEDGAIRIDVRGLPRAVPEHRGAVRMTSADGGWVLHPLNGRIRVRFWLVLDPVRVPRFFANRRLKTTVGGTLANLAERFPCQEPS